MTKKDLAAACATAVLAAVVASAGTHYADAAEGGAVNARPVAPQTALAPGSFADIIARVAPAVVSIEVEKQPGFQTTAGEAPGGAAPGDPFEDLRRMFPQLPIEPQARAPEPVHGAGSGFFISADGYIVTNNHVVDGARKITVRTKDDRTLPARLVGRDPATDLAVIKVTGGGYPFVNFEDRAQPRVGDWVVALGNPFGLGGTATVGIVSALSRPNISGSSYVDYMQIDAPINRGNSGGPSFDVYGRVVGVNSAIFSPSGGSVGIGFDIPANVAAGVVRQLISTGKVVRGYIGASVQDVTPEIAESIGVKARHGALVAEVTPDGPSARAGLQIGDLIETVDGRPVHSASQLTREVALVSPGQLLHLQVSRDGHPLTLTLTATVRPPEAVLAEGGEPAPLAPQRAGGLGLMVAPDSTGGLRVRQVNPASDAADKGVRPGDVVVAISGRRVHTTADAAAAITQARAEHRKEVLLLLTRNGQHIYLAVEPMAG